MNLMGTLDNATPPQPVPWRAGGNVMSVVGECIPCINIVYSTKSSQKLQ